MNGRTNKDVIEYIFQRKLDDEEALVYTLEKEALYRKIYKPYIAPVEGLLNLLEKLSSLDIPMAIATSGIEVNIEYMFSNIPIRKYFKYVVNSSHIKKGKPDPEIYLKAAEFLNVLPKSCLAFEDATVGIASAKGAGMKVIALTTTHPDYELIGADFVIKNYIQL